MNVVWFGGLAASCEASSLTAPRLSSFSGTAQRDPHPPRPPRWIDCHLCTAQHRLPLFVFGLGPRRAWLGMAQHSEVCELLNKVTEAPLNETNRTSFTGLAELQPQTTNHGLS